MAVYKVNEDGNVEVIRAAKSQGELEALVQAKQIAEGITPSPCIKDTLAVATGKNKSKHVGEG